MYTYMTPDEFLDLVTPADFTQQYSQQTTDYLKILLRKDAAPLGIPYLEIEIDKGGGRGRIYAHEGRHRSQTSRLINGGQSTLPVAIKFVVKGSKGNPKIFLAVRRIEVDMSITKLKNVTVMILLTLTD